MGQSIPTDSHDVQQSYPYLVVHEGPEKSRKYPILFMRQSEKEMVTPSNKALVIAIPDNADTGDGVTVTRDFVISCLRMHMLEQRHSMCVVFSAEDSVCVQNDGSVTRPALADGRQIMN